MPFRRALTEDQMTDRVTGEVYPFPVVGNLVQVYVDGVNVEHEIVAVITPGDDQDVLVAALQSSIEMHGLGTGCEMIMLIDQDVNRVWEVMSIEDPYYTSAAKELARWRQALRRA